MSVWKKVKKQIPLMLLLLFTMLLLSACGNRAHYEEVEKRALEYYQEKYGTKNVSIESSIVAGNYGLFGLIGVKDRAYEMSDGYYVYWDDDEETFSDNAQAEQIYADFYREILEPQLSSIPFPMKTKEGFLNRTGFESFDESVFTAYYDGDIKAFLKTERPKLTDFEMALESIDEEAAEKTITAFYEALAPYVSGGSTVYILTDGLHALEGDDWNLDEHGLNIAAKAFLGYEDKIDWYRQVYIEVLDGIYMTSAEADFVLEEGDIRFEVIGTCADLQAMLDEGYYSLPVDAEENKDGGYLVHDQRHEDRVVLDDPSAPLYKIVLSQRVLDLLDSRNCTSVYVYDARKSGAPFMMYYGPAGKYPYHVYQVSEANAERSEYEELNPEYLYYFGTHQRIAYED